MVRVSPTSSSDWSCRFTGKDSEWECVADLPYARHSCTIPYVVRCHLS
jgi:hypothetical protein